MIQEYNQTVEYLQKHYVGALNKVQDSDITYSDFIKEKMEKFSSTVMQFGLLVKNNGEDLYLNSKIINSQTDVEIFIETNKSPQPFVEREIFEVYEESVHGKKKN